LEKTSSPIAIFDLDYTLLDGDSEVLLSRFLFERGLVDAGFLAHIEDYYRDYERGQLNVFEYEEFLLHPLTLLPLETLRQFQREYLERIRRLIRPAMLEWVNWHRAQGHTLLLITASNSFVAEPIAELLGFPHLICTRVERDGQQMTGKLTGIPAFRAGKVQRMETWLCQQGLTLKGSYAYSDSHNDLPLLELVDHPVTVSPDPLLKTHAQDHGWAIISTV
jgi:HAD superfamily hydrolase (TIGR01490 family)